MTNSTPHCHAEFIFSISAPVSVRFHIAETRYWNRRPWILFRIYSRCQILYLIVMLVVKVSCWIVVRHIGLLTLLNEGVGQVPESNTSAIVVLLW